MKESEKAMKLMQALSGVDEELLERSGERKTGHKIVHFMNRYGKGCAACLCLIVAGAALFAMRGVKTDNTAESVMEMAPGLQANMTAGGTEDGAAGMTAELECAETVKEEPAETMNSGMDAGEAPAWLDIEELVQQAEHSAEQDETEKYSGAQNNGALETGKAEGTAGVESTTEDIQQNATEELRQSRKAEPLVPDSYSYIEETLSENGESRTVEWSDGGHDLWLRFTQTELTTDVCFEAEPPVYTVAEAWRELIAEKEDGERQQLALLYEDGLLVEYCGYLTSEELIVLFESLL